MLTVVEEETFLNMDEIQFQNWLIGIYIGGYYTEHGPKKQL